MQTLAKRDRKHPAHPHVDLGLVHVCPLLLVDFFHRPYARHARSLRQTPNCFTFLCCRGGWQIPFRHRCKSHPHTTLSWLLSHPLSHPLPPRYSAALRPSPLVLRIMRARGRYVRFGGCCQYPAAINAPLSPEWQKYPATRLSKASGTAVCSDTEPKQTRIVANFSARTFDFHNGEQLSFHSRLVVIATFQETFL